MVPREADKPQGSFRFLKDNDLHWQIPIPLGGFPT